MYKTVRHGENSLQYKILAQQEEGIANINVKCKKTKKRKIFGIFAIVILLVFGIIASAVLIPLVLANDFITLTGTFQKFSVSTLRRTHSGNHVVVIAKKPHGWIASRQSVLHSNQLSNSSVIGSHLIKKENKTKNVSFTKNLPTTSTSSDVKPQLHPNGNILTHSNGQTETTDSALPTKSLNFDFVLSSTKNSKDSITETTQKESHPTRIPFWNSGNKWSFESSSNFASWLSRRISNHPVLSTSGALIVVSLILLVVVLLLKNTPEKKKHAEESTDQNEDKTKLLKSPTRGSDEE